MKRLLLLSLLALTACGAGPSSPTGGRPELPTGVEVRHPAAPAGTTVYLNLLTESGESVYQQAVTAGATRTEVNPALWREQSGRARPIEDWLPEGADDLQVSAPGTPVLLLHWVMWQDRDGNGQRAAGETLDLMTHDRAVYAEKAVTVTFKTAAPDMRQQWQFAAGWSRAEHYVYLPSGQSTYRRSLQTQGLGRYELHVPTPITSQ
ncbi:hypothetical protein F8S09_08175 [Deinococcus sp. SDU3-2]|uniref:Uncharacterized protein n=1 Tax=Deinococcus terrestris TaxID=2651870 RepID=A0A7X1TRQ8_9DEIO|nr:hypothetical protein [Deinococcus terrestris]MPY66669.1 hypothetical protein [Deinococcus terrestris]